MPHFQPSPNPSKPRHYGREHWLTGHWLYGAHSSLTGRIIVNDSNSSIKQDLDGERSLIFLALWVSEGIEQIVTCVMSANPNLSCPVLDRSEGRRRHPHILKMKSVRGRHQSRSVSEGVPRGPKVKQKVSGDQEEDDSQVEVSATEKKRDQRGTKGVRKPNQIERCGSFCTAGADSFLMPTTAGVDSLRTALYIVRLSPERSRSPLTSTRFPRPNLGSCSKTYDKRLPLLWRHQL